MAPLDCEPVPLPDDIARYMKPAESCRITFYDLIRNGMELPERGLPLVVPFLVRPSGAGIDPFLNATARRPAAEVVANKSPLKNPAAIN